MPVTVDIPAWLAELGVRPDTLSAEQLEQFDRDGFLPLVGHMPPDLLDGLRARTDELLEKEGASAGHETPQDKGVAALADLLNKGEIFDRVAQDPVVLAAVFHVLGENMRVYSLNYRAILPGEGHQGLHGDWKGAVAPGDFYVVNSMWCLDDFTVENGATRVVPGSHLSGKWPTDVLADAKDPHPDQVSLTAPAGSVIIFNSHVWHGATHNSTQQRRRGLTMAYGRRDIPQQLDQRAYIRKAVYDRLSPAARYLRDV